MYNVVFSIAQTGDAGTIGLIDMEGGGSKIGAPIGGKFLIQNILFANIVHCIGIFRPTSIAQADEVGEIIIFQTGAPIYIAKLFRRIDLYNIRTCFRLKMKYRIFAMIKNCHMSSRLISHVTIAILINIYSFLILQGLRLIAWMCV